MTLVWACVICSLLGWCIGRLFRPGAGICGVCDTALARAQASENTAVAMTARAERAERVENWAVDMINKRQKQLAKWERIEAAARSDDED